MRMTPASYRLPWQVATSFFVATTIAFAVQLVNASSPAVPPNSYGQEIPQAIAPMLHANEPVPSVRTGCVTSRPGSAPFNVEHATGAKWEQRARAALTQMAVPLDVQTEFVRRVRAGQISDTVQLSNSGGIAMTSREQYLPSYTGTYTLAGRDVVCMDTKLALRPNETTGGALYVIAGYHIAVLQACGNLALLMPGVAPGPVVENVHVVPEPSSVWLVLAGLAALAVRKGVRGRVA